MKSSWVDGGMDGWMGYPLSPISMYFISHSCYKYELSIRVQVLDPAGISYGSLKVEYLSWMYVCPAHQSFYRSTPLHRYATLFAF